jgi:hypothetical protein
MTKSELLQHVAETWDMFRGGFADLDEAQMMRPGPEGWAVKDHIAHVTAWERILLVRHVRGRSFAEAAEMDEVTSHATQGMTAETGLNDYFFERDRDLTLAAVLLASKAMHRELLDAIDALPDERLMEPSLLTHIADNTYEHYEEHRRIIESLRRTLHRRP